MNKWQEEQLHALLTAKDEKDFFSTIEKSVPYLGFDQFAFGLRLPIPVSQPKEIIFSNYNPSWEQRYMRENYSRIDPTVAHAMTSTLPLFWDDALFAKAPEFWEEARSFDLNIGVSKSNFGANGICSLMTLARSHEEISENEMLEHSMQMIWMSQLVHEGASRFLIEKNLPELLVNFTDRELEVLRWTAEGKTSNEIGAIMRLSHKTVNYHIANAIQKLNATNKTSAAIKAISLGLI